MWLSKYSMLHQHVFQFRPSQSVENEYEWVWKCSHDRWWSVQTLYWFDFMNIFYFSNRVSHSRLCVLIIIYINTVLDAFSIIHIQNYYGFVKAILLGTWLSIYSCFYLFYIICSVLPTNFPYRQHVTHSTDINKGFRRLSQHCKQASIEGMLLRSLIGIEPRVFPSIRPVFFFLLDISRCPWLVFLLNPKLTWFIYSLNFTVSLLLKFTVHLLLMCCCQLLCLRKPHIF